MSPRLPCRFSLLCAALALAACADEHRVEIAQLKAQVATQGKQIEQLRSDVDRLQGKSESGEPLDGGARIAMELDAMSRGIHRATDGTFRLERWVMDNFVRHAVDFTASERPLPEPDDAGTVRIVLHGVRPDGFFGRFGFEDGDRVLTVDGLDVTTADRSMEAYMGLFKAKHVTIKVDRRGTPVTLQYDVQ